MSRLGLLKLVLVCGNFFWEMVHCLKAEQCGMLPSAAVNEQGRRISVRSGESHLAPVRLCRPSGETGMDIPGSARYEHDKQRESTGGNPPSGQEKPELPCLVPFTPRNNQKQKSPSGEDTHTENQSWNCAYS
jgi:hypothetical protein